MTLTLVGMGCGSAHAYGGGTAGSFAGGPSDQRSPAAGEPAGEMHLPPEGSGPHGGDSGLLP
ncbi:MAG: hypothetical protein ACLTYN_03865 [Dysosmobacter welbionis]